MSENSNELLQTIATRLERIETEFGAALGRLEAKTEALGGRMDRLETDLSFIRVKTEAQPDMRLLFQNVKLVPERVVILERDMTMLRSAMNDYSRESVTPGEIQAIHEALDALREADLNREARLRVLEAHGKIVRENPALRSTAEPRLR